MGSPPQPFAWFFDGCTSCHCCRDADTEADLSEPLLGGPSKARLLNERLLQLVRDEKREELIRLYKEEDTDLLYAAYVDLFKLLDNEQFRALEKETEKLFTDHITEEEVLAILDERPALKVLGMKMFTYRSQKIWF